MRKVITSVESLRAKVEELNGEGRKVLEISYQLKAVFDALTSGSSVLGIRPLEQNIEWRYKVDRVCLELEEMVDTISEMMDTLSQYYGLLRELE